METVQGRCVWVSTDLVRIRTLPLPESVFRCDRLSFWFAEKRMAALNLKNMDVDALLGLRADVEKMLVEKGRDLQRQLMRLGVEAGKRRGRPPAGMGRTSAMKGVKIAPKYRGPGGETWAGRGATPRWLKALAKEGHSIEEFLIGAARKGRSAAAAKTVKKRKPAANGRRKKKEGAEAAKEG
jgi:DNA-binding protein H-NS